MADYKVTDTQLTNIANAIRTKGGTSEELEFPTEFISAVNAISGVTAADEGKVVSNGALVAQQSGTATTNGTVDTTIINSLSVNVPQTVVMPISLTVTPPTKAEYEKGDTLDLTGIAVVANYSDGTTAVVTGDCTFSPDDGDTLDTAGNITITATYNGTGSVSGGSYSVQLAGTTSVSVTETIEIVSWASGTGEQISAMIRAARAGTLDLQADGGWAVGDTKTIAVGSFASRNNSGAITVDAINAQIVITSFGDYMNCGGVLQFDFETVLSGTNKKDSSLHSSDSAVEYKDTYMKKTILPNIVNALPEWLKDLLLEFDVLVANRSAGGTIETVSGNKLALRSELEVFGNSTNSYTGEGAGIIPYYQTSSNRYKNYSGWGDRPSWWLRSPKKNSSTGYLYVSGSNSVSYYSPIYTEAIAPFGCL